MFTKGGTGINLNRSWGGYNSIVKCYVKPSGRVIECPRRSRINSRKKVIGVHIFIRQSITRDLCNEDVKGSDSVRTTEA